ncbi:hypothetical protein G8A07_08575 [Roseateles sp. DAIF2]|uniref:hypothetical protein n=1 Tax=Roseateles sp. DAIF2 TaxID=2714952 RepID=UPI0018A2EC28|nr:hypothetical protein [Roseateles sp. DAIF2]QPF72976.1 hypothetical protein G8A07_08575 [Roseateles sp. DAIF2]
MHLMISHASTLGEACAQAQQTLALPRLAALLGLLAPAGQQGSDEYALQTPQEQAQAALWGWPAESAALPLAAAQAEADGIATEGRCWALLSPLHMSVGSDQVTALNPDALALDEAESRDFFESLAWLFPADEGWHRAWGAPTRWYVAHEDLAGLACASLERVINRNVDPWMPEARRLRTLQNELQMALHRHPLGEAREARGALALNSVWISGAGRALPRAVTPELRLDERLREPLLAEDWTAWAEAWVALDAGPVAELLARAQAGEDVGLTLCGERLARRYRPRPAGGLTRLWQRIAAPRADVHKTLESL